MDAHPKGEDCCDHLLCAFEGFSFAREFGCEDVLVMVTKDVSLKSGAPVIPPSLYHEFYYIRPYYKSMVSSGVV